MSDSVPSAAVDLATEFEGFSAVPYLDPVGIPTIGYGSIWRNGNGRIRVTMDDPPIDEPTARQWMAAELQIAARAVRDYTSVVLTENERAALDDFVFNLGVGNFRSSTLLRRLNAGDYVGAAREFDRWDHAGGKVLAGLLRRRQAETDLFLS